MRSRTILSAAVAGLFLSAAAAGQTYSPAQIGHAMMRLNAAPMDHGTSKAAFGSLWNQLRNQFAISEVNPELVRSHERRLSANSAYFNRTIDRSKPYLSFISAEVAKRGMPAEIALLPFIESAFVTKARSPVGASGLWQFMPATGRQYGLEQTPLYDGRHDVYAATHAALNYLQYLYGMFGDWSLALAAYNWGEGNVGRAVARARAQGLDPVYENLRMPNETRNYVPKLLAVRNIVNNPDYFGISLTEIDTRPYFKAVQINQPIDISAAARLAGISETEFLTLNPAFNAPVFLPQNGRRKMLIPAASAGTFERNYSKADKNTLLSWDVYTTYTHTGLSAIAAETGMSVGELRSLNNLRGNTVSAGRSILVAKNSLNHNSNIGIDFAAPDKALSAEPAFRTAAARSVPDFTVQPLNPPAAQREAYPAVQTVRSAPVPERQTVTVVAQTAAIADTAPATGSLNTAADSLNPAVQNADGIRQNFIVQTAPQTGTSYTAALPEAATPDGDELFALAQAASRRLETEVPTAMPRQTEHSSTVRSTSAAPKTPAGIHRVESGDTLFNIARRYNVSVADLITANNIRGNNIRLGQTLNIAAARSAAPAATVRQVSYTIRQGDTINDIARRFNMNADDVRRANDGSVLIPGKRIQLIGS
ncbi:LysM peptidoglycan-binding domain-containing protein [Neisseria leonii]|uniref:LysM peptidoglycan-binding domain-containing protein n=1 Tax=Neisseria leonii TaxID=2995413 RepID=A0A9X4IA34_9NEIS|nr:LysM peptidoglycan-binding domain-containing protein [Neisseria sp. 51.81]MDD9326979.1 LysM peptidoglycan-binding domain-containing protein [Neisseria sp. 51.81]